MGPFTLVNPANELAIALENGPCSDGLSMTAKPDDYLNNRQQFYLGQHGLIHSAACPGLVISVDDSNTEPSIKLKTSSLGDNRLQWKFVDGMIESVLNGLVIAKSTDGAMALQSKNDTNTSSATWKRRNTRALDSKTDVEQSNWKNKWTVSFITSGYEETSLVNYTAHQTDASFPICYKSSPAFSASFEEFAKSLEIRDPSDEDQCREMREALGFDKDCESEKVLNTCQADICTYSLT
jgi:hypothetical protein